MKKKHMGRWIRAAGAAMTALALLAGFPLQGVAGTLKVGLLAPITGPAPDWGKKQVVGMEMALEKVNNRGGVGGIAVEAVIRDSAGDPAAAVRLYRKIAEEGVLVVIGPLYTNECEALFPVTNEVKTAVIATASTKPGLSDLAKRPYAFRMTVTSDKKEGPLAKAWVSTHGIRTVVILHDRDSAPWETLAKKVWPAILKDLNVEILNRDDPISFPLGQTDFTDIVKRAERYKADGICIAAFPEEAGVLLKEIRRQGLTQPILGGSATANPKVIEIAGPAAEGLWSESLFYPEEPNPKVKAYVGEFRDRCKKRYPDMNCDPEQYDVVVHDILLFLADVMRKKRVTADPARIQKERDAVRDGLANMGVWRGTAGMMAFDKKGDGIRTIHILKVKNGRWQPAF